MAKYICVYNNNPTENYTDGTLVSENKELFNPLTTNLDASKNETKYIKFALRCKEGYETKSDTIIKFNGDNSSKWEIAQDNGIYTSELLANQAKYYSELTVTDTIADKNKCFWLKVTSDENEDTQTDVTTSLNITTKIGLKGE